VGVGEGVGLGVVLYVLETFHTDNSY